MKTFATLLCVCILAACGGGSETRTQPTYSLGGSISGLGSAIGLTLANGAETLPIAANASTFTFSTLLAPNASYNATVVNQPSGLSCSITGGTGTITGANVNTVAIQCIAIPTLALFAGNLGGAGNVDGIGVAARFYEPKRVATDNAGNIYVAGSENRGVRKITPDGVVSTLAGTAGTWINATQGIATDGAGNVYMADTANNTIRKITAAGVMSTFAGTAGVYGSADGVGAAASFTYLTGIATDSAGNVYAADTNNSTIRKITSAGVVSTLAGTAGVRGSADGKGAAARFNLPMDIATDSEGNVYVADTNSHTIRKITPSGVVSTLAGTAGVRGGADGSGAAASFDVPAGIATDSAGNVYVANAYGNSIRKITPAGLVSTLAGSPGSVGNADGSGAVARFCQPYGVATDHADNVYVADSCNNTIRKITSGGLVSTFAGAGYVSGSADGAGAAARFATPQGIATDGAGNVFVADSSNNTIRKITQTGGVSTLAGVAGLYGSADGPGAAARFASPQGIATDSAGNVYVADTSNYTIRKITPAGVVSTVAGTAGVYGISDGIGAGASFGRLSGIAADSVGNVYAVSPGYPNSSLYVDPGGGNTIRKITPAGVVSTLAGTAGVYGRADGIGAAASFAAPQGIATDSAGNVYVADTNNNTIRKVSPAGVVTTLAGTVGVSGSADGIGAAASFNQPWGIATDVIGNIYVADNRNNSIRKITPTGVVSTMVGVVGRDGFTAGTLPGGLSSPVGLAISGKTLYITLLNGVAVVKNLP